MATNKTQPTTLSVADFIAAVPHARRRQDAQQLLELFSNVTGWKAQMWGPSIVGFGAYHYTYESGRSGSMCAVGFSPRKANLVIYVSDFPGKEALLQQLGKHTGGIAQCLYLKSLADIDLQVLAKLIQAGLEATRKAWPVTAS